MSHCTESKALAGDGSDQKEATVPNAISTAPQGDERKSSGMDLWSGSGTQHANAERQHMSGAPPNPEHALQNKANEDTLIGNLFDSSKTYVSPGPRYHRIANAEQSESLRTFETVKRKDPAIMENSTAAVSSIHAAEAEVAVEASMSPSKSHSHGHPKQASTRRLPIFDSDSDDGQSLLKGSMIQGTAGFVPVGECQINLADTGRPGRVCPESRVPHESDVLGNTNQSSVNSTGRDHKLNCPGEESGSPQEDEIERQVRYIHRWHVCGSLIDWQHWVGTAWICVQHIEMVAELGASCTGTSMCRHICFGKCQLWAHRGHVATIFRCKC